MLQVVYPRIVTISFLFWYQNESELFGRTIRVNLAKPMKVREGASRAGGLH